MINIADIHDCFGCGVCAKACPKQIIALKLNKNGFYEPRIESADQCIKCSICVEVCAFAADSQVIDLKPTSYAAWSLNDDIRKNSSSGGIALQIFASCRCSQLFLVSCDIMFRNLFCIIITDDAYFEALLQHLPADFKSDSPGG